MSTADKREKWTGIMAVSAVRIWGGCLEHPKRSRLWKAAALPRPDEGCDEWGGFTVAFPQMWFGHPAEKWTWIYICGIKPEQVPEIPFALGEATHKITNGGEHPRFGEPGYRPEVSRYWRDATPPALAQWLLSVARTCRSQNITDLGGA